MPMTGEVKIAKGPSGKGVLRQVPDGLKVMAEDGTVYPIPQENIPEYLKPIYEKEVLFRLSTDEMTLRGISPWGGQHLARFASFFPWDEDGQPEPRLKKGGPYRWYDDKIGKWKKAFAKDKLQFTAMNEIVSGDYEGLQVGYFLDYIFVPREGNETGWVGSSKVVENMEKFLRAAGVDFVHDSLPWNPENVLPALQTMLIAKDAVYQMGIEEGQIAALSPLAPGVVPTGVKPRAG